MRDNGNSTLVWITPPNSSLFCCVVFVQNISGLQKYMLQTFILAPVKINHCVLDLAQTKHVRRPEVVDFYSGGLDLA